MGQVVVVLLQLRYFFFEGPELKLKLLALLRQLLSFLLEPVGLALQPVHSLVSSKDKVVFVGLSCKLLKILVNFIHVALVSNQEIFLVDLNCV